MGAKPLPGQADYRVAFDFTAGTRDGGSSIAVASGAGRTFTGAHRRPGALLLRQRRRHRRGRLRRLRHRRPRGPGIRLRQLRDARREGQGRPRAALLPRGCGAEDEGDSRPVCRPSLQGAGGASARREGDADRHRPAIAERRRDDSDELRHRDRRLRHRRRQHQRRTSPTRSSPRSPARRSASAQESLDAANPHATGFALPGLDDHRSHQRRPRKADGPQRRRVPARHRTDRHRGEAVGGARRALRPSGPRRQRQLAGRQGRGGTRFISARTTTRRDRRPCSPSAPRWPRMPRHRNVVLAFWSGEELGLLGSAAFIARPPVPIDQLAAYLNFDMVGRMQDNKLTIQAVGTSPAWGQIIEQANVLAGFDLQLQADPYQPTDVANFNAASVPCLAFFTGVHADYHRPDRHRRQDRLRGSRSRRRLRRRHPQPRSKADRVGAGVHEGRPGDAAGRRTRRRSHLHRDDSRLLERREGAAAERRDRRRPGRDRRACRRATSSSKSPARRSPTSTTTPTRWTCSRSASRRRSSTSATASERKRR